MVQITINKAPLNKNFTGINTVALGSAVRNLKLCGLKLYLYLAGNKEGFVWNLNPAAYADWLGIDYKNNGRTVRKAITDGIKDLEDNGYLKIEEGKDECYKFLEQNVPENEQNKLNQ